MRWGVGKRCFSSRDDAGSCASNTRDPGRIRERSNKRGWKARGVKRDSNKWRGDGDAECKALETEEGLGPSKLLRDGEGAEGKLSRGDFRLCPSFDDLPRLFLPLAEATATRACSTPRMNGFFASARHP